MWIIIANSSRARLFSAENLYSNFKEFKDFAHPESRLKEQEFNTDTQGRTYDSVGKGRHAKSKDSDAHTLERLSFAKQIATYLEKFRAQGEYNQLVVVASPKFIGDLRNQLSTPLTNCIRLSITKDLTLKPIGEIQDSIARKSQSLA